MTATKTWSCLFEGGCLCGEMTGLCSCQAGYLGGRLACSAKVLVVVFLAKAGRSCREKPVSQAEHFRHNNITAPWLSFDSFAWEFSRVCMCVCVLVHIQWRFMKLFQLQVFFLLFICLVKTVHTSSVTQYIFLFLFFKKKNNRGCNKRMNEWISYKEQTTLWKSNNLTLSQ